jgi:hypothetical protein
MLHKYIDLRLSLYSNLEFLGHSRENLYVMQKFAPHGVITGSVQKKHLINNESVETSDSDQSEEKVKEELKSKLENSISPTRYGDWEKNGRCIDF